MRLGVWFVIGACMFIIICEWGCFFSRVDWIWLGGWVRRERGGEKEAKGERMCADIDNRHIITARRP